jgi:hypothetical protein
MLKLGDRIFIKDDFSDESEIETVVIENADYIFGPSSIFMPKALIKTTGGVGTIPDGFVVDLAAKKWFIVEAELSQHNLWTHIAPQIAKQLTASVEPNTRSAIANMVIRKATSDQAVMEKFAAENIAPIHIHQLITQILQTAPVIGIPIDEVSADLKVWATGIRAEVKLWEINKYVEFGNTSIVLYQFPEEYKPAFDTEVGSGGGSGPLIQYDITVKNLLEAELMHAGQILTMSYKPEGGTRKNYSAIVNSDGTLVVMNKTFTSPSYAALYCIQSAGSPRKTTNGWTSWKDPNGNLLSKLREKYLKTKSNLKV